MATGFDILISPEASAAQRPVDVLGQILSVILSNPSIDNGGCHIRIYRGEPSYQYGEAARDDPRIVLKKSFDEPIPIEDLNRIIEEAYSEDIYVGVSYAYERLRWNNETCDVEPSFGSVLVEYESPLFHGGYRAKALGSYHIHFDDWRYFTYRAVNLSRCPVNSPTALSKLMEYGNNIRFALDLFKELARTIDPEHQIVVIEGDRVNPLVFHMVYHRQVSGYLFDLQKILQLHAEGGGYFYEGFTDYDKSERSLMFHGLPFADDIRSASEAETLMEQVEFYTALLSKTISTSKLELSPDDFLDIVTSCSQTEVEVINNGFCITHPKFLDGYLDVLYLRLLDAVAGAGIPDEKPN